ncbi:fumarate hydratase [candidate division TA06 bacterium DG_24]|jgi:fumarate hydratase subunit beta|uniref:Fumarate hydratase n=3 Tax=Bacteria division TA06 TaxID=1156500 RepID=A0A0S8JJZ7_UNCT6|nr:MAG: fumarate hydratase [candidate division TA06 bacterium DG_24]KPK68023.1 MAG: fumarate hydratase [candidate division TA06 bacterium SM23_40]KPL09132.1 MAG: fumarate hydratase [candidate division TA06 bacterium SM1_40]
MSEVIRLTTPMTDEDAERLTIGDRVLITGIVYTGRDAAHKRLVELLDRGEELPIDLAGQIIYYVGPSPARPGKVIGSAGPTTSYRMDSYAPRLIARGLKGMIGKGPRSEAVRDAMIKHKAIYFAATGGAAALIARAIVGAKIVAYEDLGAEAIRELEVKELPVIVANDVKGGDLYSEGIARYQRATA